MSTLDLILPAPPAKSSGLIEIPAGEYHADPSDPPSLSSSIVKLLVKKTPAHARLAHPKLNPAHESEEKAIFDLGTTAHGLLLEGEASVAVLDFPDWRTKDAQAARDEARSKGLTPLLAKDWIRVERMADAARRQLEMLDLDPAPLTAGKPEQSLIWEDMGGVMCRARFDWLHDDLSAVDDLKTTGVSADPKVWGRTMFGFGGDLQAAFYLRGLRKALGADPEWRFIVQETAAPFSLTVATLSDETLAHAGRRVEQAIETWARCLETGDWPGYSRETAVVDLPPWLRDEWTEYDEQDIDDTVPF